MKFLVLIGFLLGNVSLTFSQDNLEGPVVASELDLANAEDILQLYVQSFRGTAKVISKAEYEKISEAEIAYISVIDDERSTYIYGDKAKNGVILIVMKENSFSEKFSTRRRRQK